VDWSLSSLLPTLLSNDGLSPICDAAPLYRKSLRKNTESTGYNRRRLLNIFGMTQAFVGNDRFSTGAKGALRREMRLVSTSVCTFAAGLGHEPGRTTNKKSGCHRHNGPMLLG
jgi:hypothetical protein